MKKISILIIFISSLFFTVKAQTINVADSLFQAENYELAFDAYKALLVKHPKDAKLNFCAGVSAYRLNKKKLAVELLTKSSAHIPLSNFYLGELKYDEYRFEEAMAFYEKYIEKADTIADKEKIVLAQKKTQQSQIGDRLLKRVEDVKIVDSLVVDKSNFLKSFNIPQELGSVKQNFLLFNNQTIDQITYTTERGDRSYFSEFENGNSNLFTVYKLWDKWSEKTPIDDLNKESNENYPFLMLDGITLYFASDGEKSLGGYDIFITRMNPADNTFFEPENIGMPFNSPYNDYMMMIDELNKVGWFVSDRYQPEGKVAIYQFIPNVEKHIVKSENIDSLIAIAQIRNLADSVSVEKVLRKKTVNVNQQMKETQKSILISDNIIYSDAKDFKSNEARNHYFQLTKLEEELNSVEQELSKLRADYAQTDEAEKKEIVKTILSLEKRKKELNPLILDRTKMMRNEEIKALNK